MPGKQPRILTSAPAQSSPVSTATANPESAERQRLERALRDATRLKSEFFGHMSHELRTPLNGIIGFSELLLDGKTGTLDADQLDYLGEILTNGRRLLSLIDALVDLSQLEAGTAQLRVAPFGLPAAIEEACARVAAAAQRKGIVLYRSLSAGLDEVVLDRGRLLEVMHHLLNNAIKFSSEGREIRIEAAALGEALHIQIRGSAGRSDELSQLLNDYPQLDTSAIRRFGGSGLDLVLAKKIVEALSGIFAVENVAGQGPAFSLMLPCRIDAAQPTAGTARAAGL